MKEIQMEEVCEKVKESGVGIVNNFLNSEQFELANNILLNFHKNKHGTKKAEGYFPVNLKSIIIKLLKFEFSLLRNSFILKKIAKDLQFKQMAEKILDHDAELHMIDSYIKTKSEEPIIPWHNDIGYHDDKYHGEFTKKDEFYAESASTINLKKNKMSGRGIKFFIYMTDVDSKNGCLSAIPYSHHIVKAVTSLILEKKIKLETYWGLKDLRSLVLKNQVKDLIIDKVGTEKLNIFLNNSKFIEEGTKDTFDFDYKMDKGGGVIFDELAVHRGSATNKHDRLVLRYLYHRKI